MTNSSLELWFAMRESKYNRTINELENKVLMTYETNRDRIDIVSLLSGALHSKYILVWIIDNQETGLIRINNTCSLEISDIDMGSIRESVFRCIRNREGITSTINSLESFSHEKDFKYSVLTSPIIVNDRVIGCMQFINDEIDLSYDNIDLSFVKEFTRELIRILQKHGLEDRIVENFSDNQIYSTISLDNYNSLSIINNKIKNELDSHDISDCDKEILIKSFDDIWKIIKNHQDKISLNITFKTPLKQRYKNNKT